MVPLVCMFVTLITDCTDANARGRQEMRVRELFDITPVFVDLPSTLTPSVSLEASGNLVDMLAIAGEEEGIILANVAPRNGEERQWGNGTPFGYFRYKRSLVVTTLSGYMLSLPHKLELIEQYDIIDMEATLTHMWQGGMMNEEDVTPILQSQFRSLDFLSRVAKWISDGHEAVVSSFDIDAIPDAPASIWCEDSFGNLKTTLLADEIEKGKKLETRFGNFQIIETLADVPEGTAAAIVGSSGIRGRNFIELTVQGKRAAQELQAHAGDMLSIQ